MKIFSVLSDWTKTLLSSFYGKKFEITTRKILEYEEIKSSLGKFGLQTINFDTFTGDDFHLLQKELPIHYQFTNPDLSEKNIVLPLDIAMFFLKGNTWNEIANYECVKNYGMLHGKKDF